MTKKKFTESEIIEILKSYNNGVAAKDLARKHGFYHQTLYEWSKRYGGINSASELRKYKDLEQENARLKKMYAELSLHHEALKDAVEKKL